MIRRLTFTLVATLSMFAMPLPANASGDESVAIEASAGRVLTLYGYPLWQVLHSSGRGAALATPTTRRSQPLPLTQGRDLRHQDPRLPDQARMRDSPVSLSGPRFGFTFLSDDIVRKLSDDYQINVAPVVSQFGGVGARMRAGLRASNRRARHLPMRYETGLPSSVIRFRTLHASTASRRCPDELRARRQSPTIDLYRKNAFSTRAC